jgi:hypothetical protein
LFVVLPRPASSSGIFEDQARLSYFLRAPLQGALDGRASRTHAVDHDAAVFAWTASYSLRERFLLQGELSYITFVGSDEIEGDFGDFIFRFRARLFPQTKPSFLFVGTWRAGTGTAELFPYSTGSTDFEFGLAVVDTLSAFTWWARGTAVYITRASDALKVDDEHVNYATVAAGAIVLLGKRLNLEGGVTAYIQKSGGLRPVYFADIDYQVTPATAFYGSAQAEGGDRDDRANDLALGVGIRVFF